MLRIRKPEKIKLICGFIYGPEEAYRKVKKILERKFGRISLESKALDFNFTDYYEAEMGKGLKRRFIAFERLYPADTLASVKRYCLRVEKRFAPGQKRIVNIDPGYINESKLVLATTKDFSHRIYLCKGIFAEITLKYRDRCFNDLDTTFPDYRTGAYKEIFVKIRDQYRAQVHG